MTFELIIDQFDPDKTTPRFSRDHITTEHPVDETLQIAAARHHITTSTHAGANPTQRQRRHSGELAVLASRLCWRWPGEMARAGQNRPSPPAAPAGVVHGHESVEEPRLSKSQ